MASTRFTVHAPLDLIEPEFSAAVALAEAFNDILSALKDGVSRPKSLKVRTIVEWVRVLGQPGRGVHSLFRPLERSELSVF